MPALDNITVKLAERNINILSTKLIYYWNEGSSIVVGYMIDYEYQFRGYLKGSGAETPSTGWRKMSYEYLPPSSKRPSLAGALEEVYEVATKAQTTLALPPKERKA